LAGFGPDLGEFGFRFEKPRFDAAKPKSWPLALQTLAKRAADKPLAHGL
jgi:hypothetical protein